MRIHKADKNKVSNLADKHKSYRGMARSLGVSVHSVLRWLDGGTIQLATLQRVANGLQITVEEVKEMLCVDYMPSALRVLSRSAGATMEETPQEMVIRIPKPFKNAQDSVEGKVIVNISAANSQYRLIGQLQLKKE